MDMARTLVALATYNEIENLPGVDGRDPADSAETPICWWSTTIRRTAPGDGATSGRRVEPRLTCLHRAGKMGLGSATLEAMRYAIARDYDVIVTMDADWSHDPAHLPELVAATKRRRRGDRLPIRRGGAIDGWPWYRRVLSRALNRLSHAMLRLPVRDRSGAYRAYRVAKLREGDLEAFARPATPIWKKSSGICCGGGDVRRSADHVSPASGGPVENFLA